MHASTVIDCCVVAIADYKPQDGKMHYSDPEAFAQRLNSCLSKAQISQLELANRTGLKPSQINHFCCGRRLPNLRNFAKICESLPTADPRFLMGLPLKYGG